MIIDLLGHKDYIRVLATLYRKPMYFSQIQRALNLNPVQVDRALRFLRKGLWIVPRTAPTERGRIMVEYSLGKRGAAFLKSFKMFSDDVMKHRVSLGSAEVAELQSLYH